MTILKKIKSYLDFVNYFKEHPFYNKYIGKPKIKRLKTLIFFSVLPLYEELNVIKTGLAFRGYAMSYKVEIAVKKYPLIQLEASKQALKTCLKTS